MLTGESWSEAVSRPIIFGYNGLSGAIFFISFIIIHQFVLVQVVVAVLLDKIIPSKTQPSTESTRDGPQEEEEEESLNVCICW